MKIICRGYDWLDTQAKTLETKTVNAPLSYGRGFYGLAPMVCIPKPIIWFLCFSGKDFTNRPIRFNLISLISKSRTGNASSTFSRLVVYLSY